MAASILHKWFGLGKVPVDYAPILEAEDILHQEEGIGGSVTLKHFRAPGRRHSWKRSRLLGSMVITRRTFAAFILRRPLIYVTFDDPKFRQLHYYAPEPGLLMVNFDAGQFHDEWSGEVQCRFRVEALLVKNLLDTCGAAGGGHPSDR